ncbi:MAG: carboxypeptidase regulatory-like domain-containing protein [Myxococcota bacterium]
MARHRVAAVAFFALIALPVGWALWWLAPGDDVAPPSGSARGVPREIPPPSRPEPTAGKRIIAGTVQNEEGGPVMGAVARVQGYPALEATSGRDGRFFLAAAPLVDVVVTVDATGFAQGRARVEAGAAGDETSVTLALVRSDPVQGVVRNPAGNVQPRATVRCVDRDEEEDDPGLTVTTDSYGEFTLPPRAGGCEAVATHPLFGASVVRRVARGRDNDFELRPKASIAGLVVDEDGAPIAGASVAVARYQASSQGGRAQFIRARDETDDEGRFLLEQLPPGWFVLSVNARGRPPATSDEIAVGDGEPREGVEITAGVGSHLYGTVRDPEGVAIEGATVAFDGRSGPPRDPAPPATTDMEGQYELESVPVGVPFSVRVSKRGYTARVISGLAVDDREAGEVLDVALSPGDRTEYTGVGLVLIPRRGDIVVGRVVAGTPAEDAGLVRFDRIVGIDGQDIGGWSLPMAAQALRGEPETRVTIETERDGEVRAHTMTRMAYVR